MLARAIAVLSLLLTALVALPAGAHEVSMGMVEFREMKPGSFLGAWKLEPTIGKERVKLVLPSHCGLRMPELECGEKGLVGPVTVSNLGADMSAVVIKIIPLHGRPKSYTITAAYPVVSILAGDATTLDAWLSVAGTYFNYGVDHILLGVDHLLFVFGLIWIVRGGWRLVETISAFTVGHSISLAGAAFGIIGIPERPLNAAIALSIAFVGVEIVKMKRGEPGLTARYPYAVAGGFGLVHGIGFASALAGLGIERQLLPPALLWFNLGVEVGQLAFVVLVLALIRAHRRLGMVLGPRGELVPAYALGSVAMFWCIGRIVRVIAQV